MEKIKELYTKYEEIINYLIVGVLTTVVSLATYFICTETFLDPNKKLELQIANIISWIFAVAFAYFTNRKYVFKSKNKNMLKEASSFVGSRILSLLMDMFTMFIIVSVLHLNDKIGKLVSQVIVTIANYILSKLFVFKKKEN
ncbi:MAG: GtrA family protein [Bacilli bacterium]|jgi:putative flippase GtrA|nr:GtrA family protein [Bacilli bacterium]